MENDANYLAFLAGAAAAVGFLATTADAADRYGAASIPEFCRNTGRLDDVRDRNCKEILLIDFLNAAAPPNDQAKQYLIHL